MTRIVPRALVSAHFTNPPTCFEHEPERFDILAGATKCHTSCRVAYFGAIKARSDALPHVHLLGYAGVRARRADCIAQQGMARCVRQSFVEVPLYVGMTRDHLCQRHS
ncbi:MAG: hypothetical protein ACOVQ0_12630 [Novosphingobium sp.]|uniref:hypothetical protein n=1 Tax=Novosphingobium sp. TaxID=1874826 RepID=UPI003B9BFD7E